MRRARHKVLSDLTKETHLFYDRDLGAKSEDAGDSFHI
jgi:hypothetical protein